MSVDSFKFLPRIISRFYQQTQRVPSLPIPWTPITKPLNQCEFGLVTSAGFYMKTADPPFDLERERREKLWGDPTFRRIPKSYDGNQIGIAHLHINPRDLLEDINIALPIDRFKELADIGWIKSLTEFSYSFMGFQGYPPDTTLWETVFGPQVAEEMLDEKVDCVFLTTA